MHGDRSGIRPGDRHEARPGEYEAVAEDSRGRAVAAMASRDGARTFVLMLNRTSDLRHQLRELEELARQIADAVHGPSARPESVGEEPEAPEPTSLLGRFDQELDEAGLLANGIGRQLERLRSAMVGDG